MSLLNQNKVQNKTVTRTSRDNADFSKIGGLGHHLKTLRDIVILPLLHGKVFQYFNIKAPRGVLFYGPPGTGKTLVAGALANELNKEGLGKVNFFQRKGADVLDKWVGESEKKLRELFDKAAKNRPAIIFFDEIDGLAPARSEKNDHIHCSIVATLLALMDGLDNKPGVIVIGATNRIESIDPALRRAGRFDKELYFPLPTLEGRKEILQVHTFSWKYKPSPHFLTYISEATAGFCGSDLAALCSEAVLCCLKRTYPKIETVNTKVKIELGDLKVAECDFIDAKMSMLPTSVKMGHTMRNLNAIVKPLLQRQLDEIIKYLQMWPHFLEENHKLGYMVGEERYAGRLVLIGSNNEGLSNHLVPAILQRFEHLPAIVFDASSATEQDLERQLNFPSILLLPRIDEWWMYLDECDQVGIISSLEKIHAGLPILIIATCKIDVPSMLHDFFYNNSSVVVKVGKPNEEEKEKFLAPLFFDTQIMSLYSVLEKEKGVLPRKAIKCENLDTRKHLLRSCKQKGRLTRPRLEQAGELINKITNTVYNYVITKGKRKRDEDDCSISNKRMKFSDYRFVPVKSISTSSIMSGYGARDNIKKEKVDDFPSIKREFQCNKRHFTNVLTDLFYNKANAMDKSMLTVGLSKVEKSESCSINNVVPNTSLHLKDPNSQQIYDLWKRASHVTSANMGVAELELLYDTISACIRVYRNCFDSLVKNLNQMLTKMEFKC